MRPARLCSPPESSSELFAHIPVRWTHRRQSIVEVLAAAGRPLTASDLLRLLPRTSVSTLYRDLSLLEQAGAIERLLGSGAVAHFEMRGVTIRDTRHRPPLPSARSHRPHKTHAT